MIFKIRTSKKTMEIFNEISASTHFAPFILSKLSISSSIKSEEPLREVDFSTDNYGLELNRQTITGEWDDLFKCLIEMKEHRHLNDDEYFQQYLKAHLDRGARMIYAEYKYNNDFLLSFVEENNGI